MHRLSAVAHKSSTSLCTASRISNPPAVPAGSGRQAASAPASRAGQRAGRRGPARAGREVPGRARMRSCRNPGRGCSPARRRPAVHGPGTRRPAGQNQTRPPCMRWGPCPASPRQVRPVAWLAGAERRPPVPGIRARDRFPGSSHVPGVAPKVVPVSNGESLSTASANTAQEPEVNYFRSLRYPHGIHRKNGVIRALWWLSTG